MLGVPERREAEQRMQRRKPGVAAGDAQAPLVLKVFQERPDHRGIELLEAELGRLRAGPVVHEIHVRFLLMGTQPPAYRPAPIAIDPELLGELFA